MLSDLSPQTFIALWLGAIVVTSIAGFSIALTISRLEQRRRRKRLQQQREQARANLKMPDQQKLEEAAEQMRQGMSELFKGMAASRQRSVFLEWVVQTVHETRRLTEPERDDCDVCSRIAGELTDRVCGNRDKARFPDTPEDRRQLAEAVLAWSSRQLQDAGVVELRAVSET